jgi:hypothetical protein
MSRGRRFGPRLGVGLRVCYFLSDEEPRAIIPSAAAKSNADNRGRFSASDGAVCANSDANWGVVGLGAGGGGAGRRPTTSGNRATSPRTSATAATTSAAVVGPYSGVSQKNRAAKSAITTNRKRTAATSPNAAGTAMRFAAVCAFCCAYCCARPTMSFRIPA